MDKYFQRLEYKPLENCHSETLGTQMKVTATSIVVILLMAGCARKPTLDVSGEWHFFHGGRFTLVQDGKKLTGSGHILTDNLPTGASDFRIPITAHGKLQGERILLTFECGISTAAGSAASKGTPISRTNRFPCDSSSTHVPPIW